jgi:hypothetical protein
LTQLRSCGRLLAEQLQAPIHQVALVVAFQVALQDLLGTVVDSVAADRRSRQPPVLRRLDLALVALLDRLRVPARACALIRSAACCPSATALASMSRT